MAEAFHRCFPNDFEQATSYDDVISVVNGQVELKDGIQSILNEALVNLINDVEEAIPLMNEHDVSVYTGKTGLVLLFLHLYKIYKKDRYLHLAEDIVHSCLKHLKGRRITFLCGDSGPLAVGAVVYQLCGKPNKVKALVESLIAMKDQVFHTADTIYDEMLYGRAGYLYALLFVNKFITDTPIPNDFIKEVYNRIIESGKKQSGKSASSPLPLMFSWHSKVYIGAAHGFAGILYTLLEVDSTVPALKSCVDFLLGLQLASGNFPSSFGKSEDKLMHWCHGAPGCIYPMMKAYEMYSDKKYLKSACLASDAIWKRGLLKKGYGLCHGAAGNGYSFLSMYRITDDVKYLYRAARFGLWCAGYKDRAGVSTPDRPFSLFEGLAGAAYFISDLLHFDDSKFPAFEL